MQYTRRTFSISSVSSKQNLPRGAYCAEKGHSGADSRGCCYSCGEKIAEAAKPEGLEVTATFDGARVEFR